MVGNRRLTAYHRLIDVPCVICVTISFFSLNILHENITPLTIVLNRRVDTVTCHGC